MGSVIRCPRCGSWNPDSDDYCGKCGGFLDRQDRGYQDSQSDEDTRILRCGRCGTMLSEGEEYCGNCGFIFSSSKRPVVTEYHLERERPYPYIVWKFPWVFFRTVIMSYEQFLLTTLFSFLGLFIAFAFLLSMGLWLPWVIIMGAFTFLYLIGWRLGTREAIWYQRDN